MTVLEIVRTAVTNTTVKVKYNNLVEILNMILHFLIFLEPTISRCINAFLCEDRLRCIVTDSVCNGVSDCFDDSDEGGCNSSSDSGSDSGSKLVPDIERIILLS